MTFAIIESQSCFSNGGVRLFDLREFLLKFRQHGVIHKNSVPETGGWPHVCTPTNGFRVSLRYTAQYVRKCEKKTIRLRSTKRLPKGRLCGIYNEQNERSLHLVSTMPRRQYSRCARRTANSIFPTIGIPTLQPKKNDQIHESFF